MAGKKWLSGHLPVWQMDRVCIRLCVSSEYSERVANFYLTGAVSSENWVQFIFSAVFAEILK
jgi:hypothetical protein